MDTWGWVDRWIVDGWVDRWIGDGWVGGWIHGWVG